MNPFLEKTLPAQLDSIPLLSGPLLECARQQGLEEAKRMKLDLALEEILVNIVKYAYPHDTAGKITVSCGLTTASEKTVFTVEITDTGRPFDVTADAPPADTDADIDHRRIGGLGVLLVKKTMDMVSYRRVNNKNVLTVGVFLADAESTPTDPGNKGATNEHNR